MRRFAALLVLGCFCSLVSASPAVEADAVTLRWALGAQDGPSAPWSSIQNDAVLGGGTQLKFLVEPMSPSFVYLILLDSTQQVHVLYREAARKLDGSATYIPPESDSFELDHAEGSETFFLLASAGPLADLDALLDRHGAADGSGQGQLVPEILGEIRRLYREHRGFTRPIEKPVKIGGRTRGTEDIQSAIDRLAVEVVAEQFYGKTITIDH